MTKADQSRPEGALGSRDAEQKLAQFDRFFARRLRGIRDMICVIRLNVMMLGTARGAHSALALVKSPRQPHMIVGTARSAPDRAKPGADA